MAELLRYLMALVFETAFGIVFGGVAALTCGFFILYLVQRKRIAREVLTASGYDLNEIRSFSRFFKGYVPMNFVTLYQRDKQDLSFRDLWKHLLNAKSNNPMVFICSEAGAGKSRLAQQLAFRLRMRSERLTLFPWRLAGESAVCLESFSRLQSMEELSSLLTGCGNPQHTYVILDAFDEFPILHTISADMVLESLTKELRQKGLAFRGIVITTRVEALKQGTGAIHSQPLWRTDHKGVGSPQNVLTLSIKKMDRNQTIGVIKSDLRNNRQIQGSERRKRLREITKNLESISGGDILSNPFFAVQAQDILRSVDARGYAYLSNEQAMERIVRQGFEKEYQRCLAGDLFSGQEMSLADFMAMLTPKLKEMAAFMLEHDCSSVSNDALDLESLHYLSTRAFVCRDKDELRFIHNLFFEYFLVEALDDLSYEHRRDIFHSKYPNINGVRAMRHYAAMMQRGSAALNEEMLYHNIVRGEAENAYDAITSYDIEVLDRPTLTIDKILFALPFAQKLKWQHYRLDAKGIESFMTEGHLELKTHRIGSLENICQFGAISSLDISALDDVTDLSPILCLQRLEGLIVSQKMNRLLTQIHDMPIEQLTTVVSMKQEVLDLLALGNIRAFRFAVKVELPSKTIELYNELYDQVVAGRDVAVITSMRLDQILFTLSCLQDIEESEKLDNSIGFLEKLLFLQTNTMLDVESDDMKGLRQALSTFHSRAGDLCYFSRKYKKAVFAYSRAIELDSSRAIFYHNRGTIYHKMKQYDLALADCNKAIELEPDNAEFYKGRGVAYHAMKQYDLAIADDSTAIELEPDNAEFYWSRGGTYHEMKQYDLAIADDSKAIELEPSNAEFYRDRGAAYHGTKQYNLALADQNKAIEFEPDNAKFYIERGVTYHEMEQYNLALADQNKAIEFEPDNAKFYIERGVTYHEMELYDLALANQHKAIELEPDNAKFYRDRGIIYHEMKQYDLAITDKSKAIELEPDKAEFYRSRGVTYHEMKQYDLAIADYNKAIELEPGNAQFYRNRGVAYHKMELYDLALANMNKAIELEPDNAEFHRERGINWREMKQYDLALADQNKAIELEPGSAYCYISRGVTYHEMKQYDLAIADENKAIELEPDNTEFYRSREDTYHAMKEYDLALADKDKAIELDPTINQSP